MKKLLVYIFHVAVLIVVYLSMKVATWKSLQAVYDLSREHIPSMSYVAKINTPNLGSNKVKKSLDKFNKMGYSNIVSYETKLIPIWITEAPDLGGIHKDGTIGLAISTLIGCPIILSYDDLKNDDIKLEQVLLHEYLHCMTYPHSFDYSDLMNTHYSEVSEQNLQKWADKLNKKVTNGRR